MASSTKYTDNILLISEVKHITNGIDKDLKAKD